MVATRARSSDIDHASLEEVAIAFAALGQADYARLGQMARLRARGLRGVDWQDLLHEAVQRSLDGTRRWPTKIPFLVFLRETIRSLASEAWRVQARERHLGMNEDGEDEASAIPDDGAGPERNAIARDLAARLRALFAGDSVALGILDGVALGEAPGETEARLSISHIDYESTRRRIRRRIAALGMEMIHDD